MADLMKIKKSFAETYSRLRKPFTIFVIMACWILASIAGPFGTYDAMSFVLRAQYWFLIVTGAVFAGYAIQAINAVLIGPKRALLSDFISSVMMTIVFAPCVIALRSFFSTLVDGLVVVPLTITLNTFLASLAIYVLCRQLMPAETGRYLIRETDDQDATPRLMRRLSPEIMGPVLRLSGRGHHVEVVTDIGRETLRLRLTDAIDEMEPIEGVSSHRSHWVACAAIEGVELDDNKKLFLRLRNGDRVPVSRGYRPKLEDAGLIDHDPAAILHKAS